MIHLYHLVSSDAPVHIDYARTPCDSPGVLKKARFHGTLRLPAKCTVLLIITIMLFTGCATPDTSESQRKTAEELGTKERKEKEEAAKRQIDGEIFLIAMENSRSIRERAYCAPSPEALGELYALLNAGDSERASAVAELVGADIVEAKARILVLKVRPFFKGIGANLVRVAGTGHACFVTNVALAR